MWSILHSVSRRNRYFCLGEKAAFDATRFIRARWHSRATRRQSDKPPTHLSSLDDAFSSEPWFSGTFRPSKIFGVCDDGPSSFQELHSFGGEDGHPVTIKASSACKARSCKLPQWPNGLLVSAGPRRTMCQYNSHVGDGRRSAGQFRSPGHADGVSTRRLYVVAEFFTLQSG